jgi:hypothetical protein
MIQFSETMVWCLCTDVLTGCSSKLPSYRGDHSSLHLAAPSPMMENGPQNAG